MRVQRLAWQLWPWRWARALMALLRGVRVHPSVVLLGHSAHCTLGRGSVLGAGVQIDLGASGRLVLGERVWLAAGTEIETTTTVSIGAGTTVQRRGSINGSVRIGRGCILAPNVFVSSGSHPFRHRPHLPIREQERLLAAQPGGLEALDRPVWIQDDCWLGVNVVVCPGVTVGKGSVVGANAVVTRDVAPYSVVGGAPAKRLSQRLEWQPAASLSADRPQDWVYALSGCPVMLAGRAALAVTSTEPLSAVLAAGVSRVQVDCAVTRPVTVESGAHRIDLQAGTASFELTLDPAAPAFGGTLVELRIASRGSIDPDTPALHVFRLTGV